MGTPSTTTVTLPVLEGAATFTIDTWEMLIRISLPAVTLSLPTGRWRGRVIIASSRPDVSAPALISSVDTTLNSHGTITIPTDVWRTFRPTSGSAGTVKVSLTVERWDGAQFVAHRSNSRDIATVTLAPSPAAKKYGAHLNPYMQNSFEDTPDKLWQLDMLQTAGADFVNTGVAWNVLESSEGVWNETIASKLDSFMTACASRGLLVINQFAADVPPAWAGSANNVDQTKLASFTDRFLARWPGTYALQTTNEPEARSITAAQVAACQSTLAARIAAYNTAHSTTILSVLGAFAEANRDYLKSILDVGTTFDAVSYHPYNIRFAGSYSPRAWTDPARPWASDLTTDEETENTLVVGAYELDEELRAHSLTKPLWVTECGFSNAVRDTEPRARLTEKQAGDYLYTVMQQAGRIPMLDVFSMHSTADASDDITSWLKPFGLATTGRRRKSQYTKFAQALSELP